jgi:hypothetical protein
MLAQPVDTRKPSNPGKFPQVLLCELDEPILRQGVSLKRMEVGAPAIVAPQAISMPREEVAELRDEASTVRQVREQGLPILALEEEQVIDEAHERRGIEVALAGELIQPHPAGIPKIGVCRFVVLHGAVSSCQTPKQLQSSAARLHSTISTTVGYHGHAGFSRLSAVMCALLQTTTRK